MTDFRSEAKELLSNATDASYTDRIVELAETIPPLRVASKRIEDQLDHRIVSWRKFSEDSLCAIYWRAMKERNPEVYAPLGKYLGFYH